MSVAESPVGGKGGDRRLRVFLTFDTEIWCDGWTDLDARFPDAYRRYVYGPTKRGDFAMPHLLKTLNDHGLTGVFFVEPLFATRFGLDPLQELVGLVNDADQEVQLHMHTEWADEAPEPLLPGITGKRQFLRSFSRAEQATLLAAGAALLREAGASGVNAFRAGNYAANTDTLRALHDVGLSFDSSYNPACACGVDDMAAGRLLTQPEVLEGVAVYPVTVFRDRGADSLRHMQLTACSFREMTTVLNAAYAAGWKSVVVVAHNFELMNAAKDRSDPVMVRRFARLCRFLERNADRFEVSGFRDLLPDTEDVQHHAPLVTSRLLTGARVAEQAVRRLWA